LLPPFALAPLLLAGILVQLHAKLVLARSFGCVPVSAEQAVAEPPLKPRALSAAAAVEASADAAPVPAPAPHAASAGAPLLIWFPSSSLGTLFRKASLFQRATEAKRRLTKLRSEAGASERGRR
jgi:hypothetical protein